MNRTKLIIEWLKLEGTLKLTQFQSPAMVKADPTSSAAQGSIQPGLEHLQRWGTHSSLGSCASASPPESGQVGRRQQGEIKRGEKGGGKLKMYSRTTKNS